MSDEREGSSERASVLTGLARSRMAASLLAVALATPAVSAAERLTVFTGETMGTTFTVKVVDLPRAVDRAGVAQVIEARLADVDGAMSTYREDSELSRFNRSRSTDWVAVSAPTVSVIEAALAVSRLTAGAFDVTVGPLVNLWGFGATPPGRGLPTEAEVRTAMARVGYRYLHTRRAPPGVRKQRAELYVDLSAIAKGFAVDEVARALEDRGIGRYLVEVGGELRAGGLNHDDRPWAVAIEQPRAEIRSLQRLVRLEDKAIATSGDYRRFIEVGGKRYSHTIDPRSGHPVDHRLASVAVIHASALQADALATALMVLGEQDGFALARREGIAALFLLRELDRFVELATPGFPLPGDVTVGNEME